MRVFNHDDHGVHHGDDGDGNAADSFPLAVPFSDAPAHVRAELDVCDLAQQDRHAIGADAEGDLLEIVQTLDVAAHAQDEFFFCQLHRAPTDLPVAALNGHA